MKLSAPFPTPPPMPQAHVASLSVGLVRTACALAFFVSLLAGQASDWPQFLGPTRNGVYPGDDLAEAWPSSGPATIWKTGVGHGFSGPVVVGHKLIIFHRLRDQETVSCLNARTGSPVWTFAYPTSYVDDFGFDDGPRATPTVAAGRVYTFGAQGRLHCLEFESGKEV